MRRVSTVFKFFLVPILILGTLGPGAQAQAASVTYKNSDGRQGTWYSYGPTTIRGGSTEQVFLDSATVQIQTVRCVSSCLADFAAISQVYVEMSHPAVSGRQSRCRWTNPYYPTVSTGMKCTATT